jgi:hypothetical protein
MGGPGIVGRATLGATVLVIAIVAWSSGLKGPYLFDDHATPVSDPASQSLSAWGEHLRATLRPVTKITYAAEAEFGLAETPAVRRAISLGLHAVTAALLWMLILRLVPSATPIGAAALTAIWFIHPVHADGVLFISGRTIVLSNALVTGSLLALATSHRWAAAVLFGLACLARETALAALLPLGVLVAVRHRGSWRDAFRELAPTLAAAALALAWIATTPRYAALAEYSMLGRPVWLSFIRQVSAVPVGFGLLFAPASLSIDYGIPLATRAGHPLFILGVLMYLAAAAGVVFFIRRRPIVSIGLALWLAALLPTQSFVPKLDALANRPLSLALAGLLLVVAPWLGAAVGRVRWRALASVAAAAALFTALAIQTTRRATLFESPLDLWQDAAAKSRVNERPHVNYALLLRQDGRNSEALEELAIAARIDPFSSQIDQMLRLFRSQEVSR